MEGIGYIPGRRNGLMDDFSETYCLHGTKFNPLFRLFPNIINPRECSSRNFFTADRDKVIRSEFMYVQKIGPNFPADFEGMKSYK